MPIVNINPKKSQKTQNGQIPITNPTKDYKYNKHSHEQQIATLRDDTSDTSDDASTEDSFS